MRKLALIIISLFFASFILGCQTQERKTDAVEGGVIGGVLGAVTGGIIGHQSHHEVGGAVIGGAVGAATGAIIGSQIEKKPAKETNQTLETNQTIETAPTTSNTTGVSAQETPEPVKVKELVNETVTNTTKQF